jgi:hypothetical protein
MRELAGLSYAEIAAVLETTPASAKQAAYDARRALHDLAKGREMDCAAVCTAVSDGDGRALRGRALRAHLRACAECRDFRNAIGDRRSKLAALAPVMPSGVLESVLASAGGGAGGGGLFAGLGVAVQSFTAVAMVAALGAALQITAGGSGSGSHRHAQVVPAPRSSGMSLLTPRADRRSGSQRAHHGPATRGAAGRVRHAAGGRAPVHRPAARRSPAAASPPAARPVSQMTPAPVTNAPTAPSGHNGPLRQVVSQGAHPVRDGIHAVTHIEPPSVAQVRDALPVKLPQLPHPKRNVGHRREAHQPR